MGTKPLARLAAAAAGGLVVFAGAFPATAHEAPEPGHNAVLHAEHHDRAVIDKNWPDCDTVRRDVAAAADLIKAGYDVWVFQIPDGEFDTSDLVAEIRFEDAGVPRPVAVPGTGHDSWIGPAANPHLLAIAVPAGWTLYDAGFNVIHGGEAIAAVVVARTCPDVALPEPTPTPTPTPAGADDEPEENGGTGGGLPVTGAQVGGMVVLGVGLVAAGIAFMGVRRRRFIDLIEG